MKKTTWADVRKGDTVELAGKQFRVVKIKPKGKKAKVTVDRGNGREYSSLVRLADRVPITARKGDRGPLYDGNDTARRWATKREAREVLTEPKGLPAGDSTVTKTPKKAAGDPWETQADRIEKTLGDLLSAKLVGISTDEDSGYYVPPVNVTTVASHLALFHGGIPEAVSDDEGKMLAVHEAQHAEALKGAPLAVNHWHTKTRPESA